MQLIFGMDFVVKGIQQQGRGCSRQQAEQNGYAHVDRNVRHGRSFRGARRVNDSQVCGFQTFNYASLFQVFEKILIETSALVCRLPGDRILDGGVVQFSRLCLLMVIDDLCFFLGL
jgi:hypothetical protein